MSEAAHKNVAQGADAGWRRATRSLANVEFRRVFFGNMAFFLAMGGQSIVRPWIAWELTDSPFKLGLTAGAMAIPMCLVAPLGGALADRVERKSLILAAQMLAILTEAIILFLYASGRIEFWHLLVASASLGCCFPLMMPARQAIVFDLVDRKEVGGAMALNMTGVNATRVLGPGISGVVMNIWGVTTAYSIALVLYGVAFIAMLGVRKLPPPADRANEPLLQNIIGGFAYLNQDRFVAILLLFGLVPQFLAMPFMNLLPALADQVWDSGELGVGILSAATGFGAVVGSFYIAGRRQDAHRLKMMMTSVLAFSALLLAFAMSPWFWPAVALTLLASVGSSIFSTLNNVAIQLVIPDAVRGRVSSFLMMSVSLPLLGAMPMGWVAEQIGPGPAVALAAATAIVAALVFYAASPKLRGLDERVRAGAVPPPPG